MQEHDSMSIGRRQFLRTLANTGAATFFVSQVSPSAMTQETDLREPSSGKEQLVLNTSRSAFKIDRMGRFTAILLSGRNCLAAAQPAPVLSLRSYGDWHPASGAAWTEGDDTVMFHFDGIAAEAKVAIHAKLSHITLELTHLRADRHVELVLWGPYPLSLGGMVGEVVGVVRDGDFAVGIQALNPKTLGGYPTNESDIEPDIPPTDDPANYPGLPAELREQQLWRGNTAMHTAFGTSLQAYCRNRDRSRVIFIRDWDLDAVAPPFEDGGVVGSKIALFACPSSQVLATLGEIELAEDLPHPMLSGTWAKITPEATSSYLIVDFGEESIDRAVAMTRLAGLKFLYHSSPFETWGHFKLKPDLFPHGWEGFRECVEKARCAGIGVGFHTLSNFITPNDPYVSPVPDPRLARIGTSRLTADVSAAQTEIPIAVAKWFQRKTAMHTISIGEELIEYESVSALAPWRLQGCKRGAWGTHATAHRRNDIVGKLMDHNYKVFLTKADLSEEIARNIAAFFNATEAVQHSFDGLEGNWSTGLGQYGCSLFTKDWYDALKPELRGHTINDASNPHHYTWHIATRYNWGEPWWGDFRKSQTLYRLKNQLFYTRNLLPRMLGWFAVRPETTVEDAEWLCARAAGYDAGFALAVSVASTAQQRAADVPAAQKMIAAIFEVVNQWETARLSGAFPDSVKRQLQDLTREFHLASVGPGEWELQPMNRSGKSLRVHARHAMNPGTDGCLGKSCGVATPQS
jgi:hypothetical protein